MSYEITTAKALEGLKQKILTEMSRKKMYASGETAESLEVKENKLLGSESIYFLDQGRAPGKFPPSLMAWVRDKLGLRGAEADQVNYLVRRKIANEGTEIYKNKSKGLELNKLVDEMLENLTKELPNEVAAEALKWL
jgi:hypothetical protein